MGLSGQGRRALLFPSCRVAIVAANGQRDNAGRLVPPNPHASTPPHHHGDTAPPLLRPMPRPPRAPSCKRLATGDWGPPRGKWDDSG
eukprot:scaffold26224_cov112-Isochrysis_galbana.AAC.3